MTEYADNRNSVQKRHGRLRCGGKRSGIFCGLLFLSPGLIWLGNTTGMVSLDMSLVWPAIMVIMGVWVLVAAMRRGRSSFPE